MATDTATMPVIAADTHPGLWLLCRAGPRLCALPLENVIEIMRPLPIEPLAQSPPFVLGLSILRGAAVPVVDAGMLFGEPTVRPGRLVALRAGNRMIAVAFTTVIGLRAFTAVAAAQLPPLLRETARDVVTAIATLDAELLHVLDAARIASDAVPENAARRAAP